MQNIELDLEALEGIIDRNGVQTTLEAIARICEEKADHIVFNYNDHATAAPWRRTARSLMQRKAVEL